MSDESEAPKNESPSETVAESLDRDERGRFIVNDVQGEFDASPVEPVERDDLGRFVVEPEPEDVEAISEPEPEVEPAPTPASISKPKRKPAAPSAPSAVGGVTVSMAALVYHARSRNSASVAAVQDRLAELGHADARGDIRGWLSDGTVKALSEFQKASGMSVTGKADRETVEALMKGTGAEISD